MSLPNILSRYRSLISRQQYQYVKTAVEFLKSVIQKPENRKSTYVSFNGGKDATIILFLTVFAYHELKLPPSDIKVLYFQEPNPFQEVDIFRNTIREMIQFQQIKSARNFKESLTELKNKIELNYIIMGSRRTDPYCVSLEKLAPSDTAKGYPEFMRVNPILEWDYQRVWSFIREFEIPYCVLYEQGYTYLGNKTNTNKNEHLLKSDGKYEPAWMAKEENECESRCK